MTRRTRPSCPSCLRPTERDLDLCRACRKTYDAAATYVPDDVDALPPGRWRVVRGVLRYIPDPPPTDVGDTDDPS